MFFCFTEPSWIRFSWTNSIDKTVHAFNSHILHYTSNVAWVNRDMQHCSIMLLSIIVRFIGKWNWNCLCYSIFFVSFLVPLCSSSAFRKNPEFDRILESKKANREGSTLRAGILDAVCAKVPLQHQVQVQKATFEILLTDATQVLTFGYGMDHYHSLVPTTSQATKEAAREEAERGYTRVVSSFAATRSAWLNNRWNTIGKPQWY